MRLGLRLRVFLGLMLIVTTGVVSVGFLVRTRTVEQYQRIDPDTLARTADIYDVLNVYANYTGTFDRIDEEADAAAKRTGQHVVVVNNETNSVIADSNPLMKRSRRTVFAIYTPQTRKPIDERDLEGTASCFVAAQISTITELPERFESFLEVVAAVDSKQPSDDPFDQAVANLTDRDAGELKRCLSQEFAYDGPTANVFVGDGSTERFRVGGIGAWLALVGLILGLAGVLAALLARRIAKPLRALTTATAHISSGSLSNRLEVKGTDEVATLGHAFNDMTARLEAAESQRVQIVRDLAHELRNPLGVLQSQIEAALDGVIPMNDASLEVMHSEVGQLTSLVSDLQQLAGFDAGTSALTIAPVDLLALTSDVIDTYRIAHPTMRFAVDVEPVIVSGDGVRLRQVISNVIRNAVQHSQADGEVKATLRQVGDVAVVAVTDTGVGIAADDLPHVFDRLWRSDESRRRDESARGSGLGLSISKAIVDAHGGTITVSSKPGLGTTFSISLPRALRVHQIGSNERNNEA